MQLQDALVFFGRAVPALRPNVKPQPILGHGPEGADLARRPALGDRIGTVSRQRPELLRFRPRLVGRQPTVLADRDAARAAVHAVLHHVDLLAARLPVALLLRLGKAQTPKPASDVSQRKARSFPTGHMSASTARLVIRFRAKPPTLHISKPASAR